MNNPEAHQPAACLHCGACIRNPKMNVSYIPHSVQQNRGLAGLAHGWVLAGLGEDTAD